MSEQDPKGFKVVDRRGMPDEERAAPAAAPQPPPRPEEPAPPGEPAFGPKAPTFLDLVGTLQFGALVNLGMIQTPDGKRSPVNLEAAKDSIDMLEILQDKTKGNLTEEEAGILSEGLYHIRMAYVAAVNAAAGSGGKTR